MTSNRTNLVEKSGILHIYYSNKTFKHWKKRWLRLQDQQLSIYQDSNYKRYEKTIDIRNYRVSVTNAGDSISHKGYTFKIYDPNGSNERPIYLSADNKQTMTQWINALRLSASIANDFLVEPYFTSDLHPIDTDDEYDYHDWMNDENNRSRLHYKSYRPGMPVATTTTLNDQNRFLGSYDEEEITDDNRWYRPRSTSPSYSRTNGHGIVHQSSSATMGSWGFDVNRSTNEQTTTTTPLPFTSNSHHYHTNNNSSISDHRTITRTPRRYDESIENYNERPVDRSSSPPPPQRFKLRTPTLPKHRDGNEFAVVDRLVLGPSRIVQSDYYPSDESPRQQQQQQMPSSSRSRQSSTRSILRRRSKSIGDFTAPTNSTSPSSPTHLTQSYHQYQYQEQQPRTSPNNHQRKQAEHELMAWQNRMLERDHRTGNNLINRPPSTNTAWVQSPRMSSKRGGFNTSQSTTRPMPAATRPISAMSNMSNGQRFESDQSESTLNASKLIKRYMELIHYLQTFYERIAEQLYGGNAFFRNNLSSDQSVFIQHCRKIAEQLQRSKPVWDQKIIELQHALRDLSSYENSLLKNETTFLQRRSVLIDVLQTLNPRNDLDSTSLSILNDIERVLQYDKLAAQLQDELSTLLHHQSLLNDFTSLLQWNRQIYSLNEQNRAENVLPSLREQISTVDRYVSNVSQNLTRCVTKLRSLEKYILSHLNTIPFFDDGPISMNRSNGRLYNETDIDTLKVRNQSDRYKDEFQRPSRQQTRPLSMHTSVNQSYHRNTSPTNRNDSYEWYRRSPSPIKTRSASMTRYIDSSEPIRGPSTDHFEPEDYRSNKWSPRRNFTHLNTNNSNNNPIPTTRLATVKSARRDNGMQPNGILKPYPHTKANNEVKKDFDIDTIDKEIYKPDKVDIPDRLIDFDNDDQMLTPNERIAKMKKKEEVRKMLSKQSMQEINEHDVYDSDPYTQRRIEKALNLQSAIAEEAKERSRQVAAKHYLNKSYQQQQQTTRLNS